MLSDQELAEAREIAEATMTATVTLTIPGTAEGGWDPVNGPTPPAPDVPLWDGRARVQAVRAANASTVDAAGQAIVGRTYKIALPWTAPIAKPGVLIDVTAPPPEDQSLAGRRFIVAAHIIGGLPVERVYYADYDQTNQGV
jgi:hypothetical protein